ncbi:MAG: hypothetical protein UW70_C0027G0006 [Candidatus Peregrinibacteria bacterium GW2011_GWA2_44_7]|nr:MAG: hypothetical protein UW70_C0027G0006 [Candidatus Peregrinibacteria bacterium GW2011_GWA2_44_7]
MDFNILNFIIQLIYKNSNPFVLYALVVVSDLFRSFLLCFHIQFFLFLLNGFESIKQA